MKAVAIFANGDRVQVTKQGLATFGSVGNVVSSRIAGGNIFVTVEDDDGCRFSYNQNSLGGVKKAEQVKNGPIKLPHVLAFSDQRRWLQTVTANEVRHAVSSQTDIEFELFMGYDTADFFQSNDEEICERVVDWASVFVIYPDGHVERLVKPKTRFDIERLPE